MGILIPALAAVVAAIITLLVVRANGAQRRVADLQNELARQREAFGATQAIVDRAQQTLRDTFQSLAAEALKENRASFMDLAKTSFEVYQQPIAQTLKQVDARLGAAEKERVAA